MFLFHPLQQESDERLMQLLAKGKKKAFEELYDRYFGKLVFFAQQRIGNIQVAEDLVQEVFIGIIQSPEKYDPERRFITWVYTVTNNACKNWYRNHSNRAKILAAQARNLASQSSAQSTIHDQVLLKQKILDALASLSEKEQIIYVLRFEEEKSLAEIAEIIGIPLGSVKSSLFYLLKKLAPQLKEFDHAI